MTTPDPEHRFLAAVAATARAVLGPDHPVTGAAEAAGRDLTPAKAAAVHEALAVLPDGQRDMILSRTHAMMRTDLSAIWSLLPGAAQSGGIH